MSSQEGLETLPSFPRGDKNVFWVILGGGQIQEAIPLN